MIPNKNENHLGNVLINMMHGVINEEPESLLKAASSLDDIIEEGNLPKKYEYFGILYAALAYDIVNERFEAQRLYKNLFETSIPDVSHLVSSKLLSNNLGIMFGHIGLREFDHFEKFYTEIKSYLQTKKEFQGHVVPEEFNDDYIVLFSLLSLLRNFFFNIEKRDKDKIQEILSSSNKLYQDLTKFDPEPWLELISTLYLQLIRRISERSITSLDISEKMKKTLYNRRIDELWKPQKTAIDLGFLEGENMLYSSPPGTGKSFLAYIAVGKLDDGKQAIYLVPSKFLASQVYGDLTNVLGSDYKIAISDRDRTDDDDYVGEKDIVVATYEKMDALLRRKKISTEKIQTVIVDEIQYLGDPQRGMALELMLTKFMKNTIGDRIQLIGLSGLLSEQNSSQLAEWMNARLLLSEWRGIKTEEMMFYDGLLIYKDGHTEKIPINLNKKWGVFEKRKFVSSYFAKSAIIKNEPILISVIKRDLATKIATELKELIGTYNFLEMDLIEKLESNKQKYEKIINQIKSIEPELPQFALDLINMIKFGIVYHHAGLPIQYRTIIENAIKNNIIDVIIATPTLEAGLNLPIKTVLFFDPKYFDGEKWNVMENRKYKNIAGRAGRPGYHKKASVIVLAMSDKEAYNFQKKFWHSDLEPIRSSFYEIIADSKRTISVLQSQLLGFVLDNENSNLEVISNYLSTTWYWKQSQSATNNEYILKALDSAINSLLGYEFLKIVDDKFIPTKLGEIVNQSMLLPDSASIIIKFIEYLFATENDDETITNYILILVGLTTEIHNNDNIVKKIIIPNEISRLKDVIAKIDDLNLDPLNLNIALKYASVLFYWIHSYSTSKIIEFCNLSSQSNTAFIEEGIVKDAFWALTTIGTIAESIAEEKQEYSKEKMDRIVKMIKSVSDYCNDGSKDKNIRILLNSGLGHIGRSTAIKLNEFLTLQNKKLYSLSQEEFEDIFPDNQETAKILYDEINQEKDYFISNNV